MHDARTQSDEEFLRDCRVEAFRGGGPGGQHRNKTSTAVRLIHQPTGLSATAGESRSQQQNRAAALRRLRHRVVLESRQPIALENFSPPPWFQNPLAPLRLKVSIKNERYLSVMGLVLDVLSAADWSISTAAKTLGISTGNLIQFLRGDPKLWPHVNQKRTAAGLRPLVGH
jgi:hypothetical protein